MGAGSVLVVGATGGLGTAVLKRLAGDGFDTAFTGTTPQSVARTEGFVAGARGHVLDATDSGAVRALVDSFEQGSGLAAYVHLAGGWAGGAGIHDLNESDWKEMFDRNWLTLRLGASAAFGRMLCRGRGSIVTIGAMAALSGGATTAPYAVAKAAVVAFTRCLAEEGKAAGVRANCIIPGIIDTESNRLAMPDASRGDWTDPADIASVISHLCGPRSVGVNGSVIMMKGGL